MEFLQNPTESYALISIAELQTCFSTISFDMKSYLNELINENRSQPVQLVDNDQIVTVSLNLTKELVNLIGKYLLNPEKSSSVIDFVLFSFVFQIRRQLPPSFYEVTLPLRKEFLGTEKIPDRWEFCLRETDAAFGFVLGSLFVNSTFGQSDREKATDMVKHFRDIFRNNFNRSTWIDSTTKMEALRKLDKIREKIAFPDFIIDRTRLNHR